MANNDSAVDPGKFFEAFEPVGSHTQNSSLASAAALTIPAGATKLMMSCSTQDIRYTLDGTTPTAAKGFLLAKGGAPVIIPIGNTTVITLIETATTAVLEYQFGK